VELPLTQEVSKSVPSIREYKLEELIKILDEAIILLKKEKYELFCSDEAKTECLAIAKEKYSILRDKLKLYESNNAETVKNYSDIVSKIGNDIENEFKIQMKIKYQKNKQDYISFFD